jgi:hypothetical protein
MIPLLFLKLETREEYDITRAREVIIPPKKMAWKSGTVIKFQITDDPNKLNAIHQLLNVSQQ